MAEIRKRNTAAAKSQSQKEEEHESLPDITEATSEQKKLPSKDKLKIIDEELRQLRSFCLQAGYSDAEIESCASPVLNFLKESNRKKWKSRALKLLLVFSLLGFLYYCDPVFNFVWAYARYAQLQTLKYWDWTYMFEEDCLIENPFYTQVNLHESDCEGCEGVLEIEKLDEVTHTEITEDFLYNHVPVIVTDAMASWAALKKFDIDYIAELYLENPVLNRSNICAFHHTVPNQSYLKPILRQIKNGSLTEWHMKWQNCNDKPVKIFRSYYSRPYFIPPMVEMMSSNFVFTDSGVKKSEKKSDATLDTALHDGSSMTWFAQVRGQYEVRLTPDELCNKSCSTLTATLYPGEILAFTNAMWTFQYRVVSEDNAIAIAASGIWD
ncbi:uncharacterized protein [Ptychodera flava]|uniref:uncharacterized protein n=1 Tax=Ptychodera flava TaxID=63121 RepID=UPI00396A5DC2